MGGLAVLDGDRVEGVDPGRRAVTDGYRARERWFGATRGRDTSSTLAADELDGTRDYRPWDDLSRHAVTVVRRRRGRRRRQLVAGHDADPRGPAPGRPAGRRARRRPDDGLGHPVRRPARARGAPRRADRRCRALASTCSPTGTGTPGSGCRPGSPCAPTPGRCASTCPPRGGSRCRCPAARRGAVAVEVLETDEGAPGEVLTGLVAVDLDGVTMTEAVVAPDDRADPVDAVLLSGGLPGSDGCVQPEGVVVCYGEGGRDGEGGAVLARRFTAAGGGRLEAERDARRLPLGGRPAGPRGTRASPSRRAAAAPRPRPRARRPSSTATSAPRGARPPTTPHPTLTLTLDEPADVQGRDDRRPAGLDGAPPPLRRGAARRRGGGGPGLGRRAPRGQRHRRQHRLAADPPARRAQPRGPGRRSRSRRSPWPATTCPSRRSGSPARAVEGPGAHRRRHHGADAARRSALGALGRG